MLRVTAGVDYYNLLYQSANNTLLSKNQRIQNIAAWAVSMVTKYDHIIISCSTLTAPKFSNSLPLKSRQSLSLGTFKSNYSCVFGKRNYRVLVRVCVCVFVCVCFCTITRKEIDLGTRNWNTL